MAVSTSHCLQGEMLAFVAAHEQLEREDYMCSTHTLHTILHDRVVSAVSHTSLASLACRKGCLMTSASSSNDKGYRLSQSQSIPLGNETHVASCMGIWSFTQDSGFMQLHTSSHFTCILMHQQAPQVNSS